MQLENENLDRYVSRQANNDKKEFYFCWKSVIVDQLFAAFFKCIAPVHVKLQEFIRVLSWSTIYFFEYWERKMNSMTWSKHLGWTNATCLILIVSVNLERVTGVLDLCTRVGVNAHFERIADQARVESSSVCVNVNRRLMRASSSLKLFAPRLWATLACVGPFMRFEQHLVKEITWKTKSFGRHVALICFVYGITNGAGKVNSCFFIVFHSFSCTF